MFSYWLTVPFYVIFDNMFMLSLHKTWSLRFTTKIDIYASWIFLVIKVTWVPMDFGKSLKKTN